MHEQMQCNASQMLKKCNANAHAKQSKAIANQSKANQSNPVQHKTKQDKASNAS